MTPQVWNKRDPKCPTNAIYVGRPTKWGNWWSHLSSHMEHVTLVPTREEAVEAYLLWITSDAKEAIQLRADAIKELRGHHLSCWCSPSSCHADILLQIAND